MLGPLGSGRSSISKRSHPESVGAPRKRSATVRIAVRRRNDRKVGIRKGGIRRKARSEGGTAQRPTLTWKRKLRDVGNGVTSTPLATGWSAKLFTSGS